MGRISLPNSPFHKLMQLIVHPMWGTVMFFFMNYIVALEAEWRITPRLVGWLAKVGVISYSVYLTHLLIIEHLSDFLLKPFNLTDAENAVVNWLIFTPLCVLFAWGFFRLFEKPFLPPVVKTFPVDPTARSHRNIKLPDGATLVATADEGVS